MIWMDGQWIPDEAAVVSVFDRSFQFGDGLFETMRHADGKIFRWDLHWTRVSSGCQRLGIRLAWSGPELQRFAQELALRAGTATGIIRMHISRGVGRRGYSTRGAFQPRVIMSPHPVPEHGPEEVSGWRIVTARLRLPIGDPLAGWKTANRLPQILARAEADEMGANEALLLNGNGQIAEASGANVFWWKNAGLETPHPETGALPGITRAVILEIAAGWGIPIREVCETPAGLGSIQGMFLTNSAWGIIPVSRWDKLEIASEPRTHELYREWKNRAEYPVNGIPSA